MDAERFRWHYKPECRIGSNALVDVEIRLLNGDYQTLDEVRLAYSEAMSTPPTGGDV